MNQETTCTLFDSSNNTINCEVKSKEKIYENWNESTPELVFWSYLCKKEFFHWVEDKGKKKGNRRQGTGEDEISTR